MPDEMPQVAVSLAPDSSNLSQIIKKSGLTHSSSEAIRAIEQGGVKIDGKKALLDMTLTSPHCPVAEILPNQVKRAVEEIKELEEVVVKVVWDPPWDKTKMSEAARLQLNL